MSKWMAACLLITVAGCQKKCGQGTEQIMTDGGKVCVPDMEDDGGAVDGALLDGGLPDSSALDGALPDATQPDVLLPDAALPDAARPDAALPDASSPDASLPDASPDAMTCTETDLEPNDTEGTAMTLAAIDDCDRNGSSVSGALSGAGDVDFFEFSGSDAPLCIVEPTATTTTAGLRLCVFALCPNGASDTAVICNPGTNAVSPSGYPGCCITSPGTVSGTSDCLSSPDDSATVFIRVDQPGGVQCVPYTVAYHF